MLRTRPTPHSYTVTITVQGVRAEGRSHSISDAAKTAAERVAANRVATPEMVEEVNKAVNRLVHFWRANKRACRIRIAPGNDCRVRVEMNCV